MVLTVVYLINTGGWAKNSSSSHIPIEMDKLKELQNSRVEQRPDEGDYHRLIKEADNQRRVEWYENRLVEIEEEIERRRVEKEKKMLAEEQRKLEEKRRAEEKKKEEEEWETFVATSYTAFCDTGCIGITKTGLDVSDTTHTPKGYKVIATDPRVIPLNSIVEVRYEGKTFTAKAVDTGGKIKGFRVDILSENKQIARNFGRRNVEIKIIKRGGL